MEGDANDTHLSTARGSAPKIARPRGLCIRSTRFCQSGQLRVSCAVGRRVAEMRGVIQHRWPALIIGLGLQLSSNSSGYELETHRVMTRFAFDRSVGANDDLFIRLGVEGSATTKVFPGVPG